MNKLADSAAFGRLQRSVDFERVLRTRSRASSPHFALHHLAAAPTPRRRRPPKAAATELPTGTVPVLLAPVDDCLVGGLRDKAVGPLGEAPSQRWLGAVVPKRHARRAVTRSLLKRQIRAAAGRHGALLEPGLWIVRLRAPFDRADFPSAASAALQRSARDELEILLARASARH